MEALNKVIEEKLKERQIAVDNALIDKMIEVANSGDLWIKEHNNSLGEFEIVYKPGRGLKEAREHIKALEKRNRIFERLVKIMGDV